MSLTNETPVGERTMKAYLSKWKRRDKPEENVNF